MTSPVPSEAMAAYRTAIQRLEQSKVKAAQPEATTSFEALLKSEMQSGVGALRAGEQTSIDGLAGRASVQQVVEALTNAELSLQKVTAVRDRVISAYQEIIRMPI